MPISTAQMISELPKKGSSSRDADSSTPRLVTPPKNTMSRIKTRRTFTHLSLKWANVLSPGHYNRFQASWQATLTARQFAGIYKAMIRAFDGSLADAKGLLAVEQATFDECPYTAEEVRTMLTAGSCPMSRPEGASQASVGHASGGLPAPIQNPKSLCRMLLAAKIQNRPGPQRAWLAIEGDHAIPAGIGPPLRESVVGFVIAFPVSSLQGAWWEIDLLAVQPDRQGRGLGRQLIQAAAAGGEGLAHRSRAVVATGNRRSARAFARAGFQAEPTVCTLLIRRFGEQAPRPQAVPGVSVREAASAADGSPRSKAEWDVAGWPVSLPATGSPGLALLLAEQHGRPAGYAELIEVETLLYRGIWIESLAASSRAVRETLVYHAMNRAMAAGLDEVSAMVPRQNQPLLHTLLAGGFRSSGRLPLVQRRSAAERSENKAARL